jgi:hypothetical protein
MKALIYLIVLFVLLGCEDKGVNSEGIRVHEILIDGKPFNEAKSRADGEFPPSVPTLGTKEIPIPGKTNENRTR